MSFYGQVGSVVDRPFILERSFLNNGLKKNSKKQWWKFGVLDVLVGGNDFVRSPYGGHHMGALHPMDGDNVPWP